jgi:polysaccharide biosynthesis transport protein
MKSDNLPALRGGDGHLTGMVDEGFAVPEPEEAASQSGLNLNDLLFVLFRHKWKILLCTAAGIVAAAAVYFLLPPVYESQAKLFVRYVEDKSPVDGIDPQVKLPGESHTPTDPLLNSETEILTSRDLALEVVDAIGVQRLEGKSVSKATRADAAGSLAKGLSATVVPDTNIITISYRNADPKLPLPVLQELVRRYFDKHLEIHRSVGALDFVTRETARLRTELGQTEESLKQLKAKAGTVSLSETKAALASEFEKFQGDLDAAKAEFAAQQAFINVLETSVALTDANSTRPVSGDVVHKYQSLVTRETQFEQSETEFLSKYTPDNRFVKLKEAQIAGLQKQRRDLEQKYPGLVSAAAQGGRPDLASEKARLAGTESRVKVLTSRLSNVQDRAKMVSELAPRIEELERKKEVQEANYRHSEASLEKARIDETLNPSRMPNISIVQTPTAAVMVSRDVKKLLMGLAGGGLALGIAITLLIELVMDRTIKRPLELERRLRIPLLLSIPYLSAGKQRMRLHDAGHDSETTPEQGDSDLAAMENGNALQPFCDAIRDRLGVFFAANNMSHKPKLVAVVGLAKNAGASTLAAGLTSALSETTEGRVLLVDEPVAPKKFYDLLQDFKRSDMDYVVFDMPSVGHTSATLPLAGFMDMVLLVVEAEKSSADAVKRAYAQLAARTKVSVVFNKSRSYGPKWLEGEPSNW